MATQSENRIVRYSKGACLCRQGETSRDLYIIRFGEVLVYKTEGGIDVELDRLGAGAVVGEISAIDGEPRSATVVATQETECIAIPGDEFARVVAGLPDWFSKISKILVQRLREVDSKIDFSKGGDKTVHAAALIALMTYSDQCVAAAGGYVFVQSDLERELVALLSMQDAEAAEALERLAGRGLLSIDKGRVVISDRHRLEEFGDAVYRQAHGGLPT